MHKPSSRPPGLRRLATVGTAVGAAWLLAACGGGSDDGPAAPPPQAVNEVPATATASTMAFTQYALSLAATETGEPLGLGSAAAPTSESEEPAALR